MSHHGIPQPITTRFSHLAVVARVENILKIIEVFTKYIYSTYISHFYITANKSNVFPFWLWFMESIL